MYAWTAVRAVLAAFAALGAGTARAEVDAGLLSRAPAQTRVLGGMDIAALAASPSGKLLFSALQASYPRLALLSQIQGFDPLAGATEALVAADGESNANHTIILLRGRFDLARLTSPDWRLESFHGNPVLRGKEKTDPWLAVLDDSTAALGVAESIRRLLEGGGATGGLDPSLAEKARQWSREYDFWMISTAPPSSMAGGLPEGQISGILKGDVMAAVLESAVGLKLTPQIRLNAQALTRSPKDSAALAEVFRFFASVAQLTERRDPKSPPPKAPGLLERMKVTHEGNRMSISAVLTESDLQGLLRRASDLGLVGTR